MLQCAVNVSAPQPQWKTRLQKGWAPAIANAATIAGATHRKPARGGATGRHYNAYRGRLRLAGRGALDLVATHELLDLLGQLVDLLRQLLQIVVRREVERTAEAVDDAVPRAAQLRRHFVELLLDVAERRLGLLLEQGYLLGRLLLEALELLLGARESPLQLLTHRRHEILLIR